AEDGIRDFHVTGVQTCALPIFLTGGGDQEDRASGSPMLIYEGGGFRVHIWVDELMQGLSDDLPDLVDPPSPTQLGEVVPDAGHLILVSAGNQIHQLCVAGFQDITPGDEIVAVERTTERQSA